MNNVILHPCESLRQGFLHLPRGYEFMEKDWCVLVDADDTKKDVGYILPEYAARVSKALALLAYCEANNIQL